MGQICSRAQREMKKNTADLCKACGFRGGNHLCIPENSKSKNTNARTNSPSILNTVHGSYEHNVDSPSEADQGRNGPRSNSSTLSSSSSPVTKPLSEHVIY